MNALFRRAASALCLSALLSLVACGGSPSATAPVSVQGVATPSSVSVVTAKNVN